ncbi:hypothetical protein [Pseudomonas sp. DC3000-4b1]|uniref:hypothetical protein n=1 Tax=unclassified Pseudomonas TaxID=196821 RepID=UPI003CF89344
MSLPVPEPMDIPDPNIDDPALPETPSQDPTPSPGLPGQAPAIGDPPSEAPAEKA